MVQGLYYNLFSFMHQNVVLLLSRHLEAVETYNPRTGVWTVLPSMLTFGKSYCGVCVIDKPTP